MSTLAGFPAALFVRAYLCKARKKPVNYTVSIKENRQFRRLYTKGKSEVAPGVVLYYRKTNGKENRLGLTVSTKLGKAVTRNKIRRRLREIYRTHETEFLSGTSLIFVARVRAVHLSYQQLETQCLALAKKGGLLHRPPETPAP